MTLPESTPSFQNIPPPPRSTAKCNSLRIYPSFQEFILPFLTTIWDTTIIYFCLPEYTPALYKVTLPESPPPPLVHNYMRRSQNPSHPPSIYSALPEYTPVVYKVTLPECTPSVQNLPPPPPALVYNYMRHFQNLPLPEFTSL